MNNRDQSKSLSLYRASIANQPLLSREEEQELARRYRLTGDSAAFDLLVSSQLKFVVHLAFGFMTFNVPIMDLIQEGNLGLLEATRSFDPDKNVRLSTWAAWHIRSHILEAIMKNKSLVKIGTTVNQKKLYYNLPKLDLTTQEAAATLHCKEKEVIEMRGRLSPDVSFNAPVAPRSAKEKIADLAATTPQADEILISLEEARGRKKLLSNFQKTLQGQQKNFFESRMIAETPVTLVSLGRKYKFSKQRAEQVEKQIKSQLRAFAVGS